MSGTGAAAPRLTAALADRYRIDRELGAGGMATVYLAEDLKHDRKVAVKVLKPDLAAVLGAERFVVEIKTTAALQHPHILPLFDSGESDGFLWYVMPFIDGETLRARLDRETQLGVDEAVGIATAVADALDYAHRRGVIHRDIKPENILLHDGRPMVADFGIALAVSAAAGGRMTETGLSLGTPHYMSPEQATADKELTSRSDIYSLGSVLYEMLGGEPPHLGNSAQAIIMKIVTEDAAPVTRLRKAVPHNVAAAVATSLEKLPADRFTTAAEFAAALRDPAYGGGSARGTHRMAVVTRPHGGWKRAMPIVATAALVFAALGMATGRAIWHPRASSTPPLVLRYEIALPDSLALADATVSSVRYSPDGSVLAYTSRAGIMLRESGSLELRAVPGGRRGGEPFFSPDSRWIGFRDGDALVKLPLSGGATITICDSCGGYAYDWGEDDVIRYHTSVPESPGMRVLMAVPARGGVPREIARPDSSSGEAYRAPALLPGGRFVLFTVYNGRRNRLARLDVESGAITHFDQPGYSPRWVDPGYVVLANGDGTLVALPFDARSGGPTGPPVVIATGVLASDPYSSRAAVSASGAIAYPPGGEASPRQLLELTRTGSRRTLAEQTRGYGNPRYSPTGDRVAVSIRDADGTTDIWVLDVRQRAWSRLSTDGISNRPAWTPDGRRLVYSSNDDLWWMPADGSGQPDPLLTATGSRFAGSVTPDGRAVIFQDGGGTAARQVGIKVLVFDSAPAARVILPGEFNESAPSLSPDGQWLAYQSEETGRPEVYVRPYPGPGGRVPVSLGGGTAPVWSHSGRELFYQAADSLLSASVTLDPTFAVTARNVLFIGEFQTSGIREYDVSPDDQRFVMVSGGAVNSRLVDVRGLFDRLAYDARRQAR